MPSGAEVTERGRSRRRRVSISTVIILLLAAAAGLAYYLGTPPPLPAASTNSDSGCPAGPADIVIPNAAANSSTRFQPPTVTLMAGKNDTVVWDDQDATSTHVIISVSVPPGGGQWDFQMTGGHSYCVTLTAPGTYTYELYMSYGIVEGTLLVKTAT